MVLDQDDYSDPEFHQLMIDALVGVGTGSYEVLTALAGAGLVSFSGDQHNEGWEWDIEALRELQFATLKGMYDGLCKQRSKSKSRTLTTTGARQ